MLTGTPDVIASHEPGAPDAPAPASRSQRVALVLVAASFVALALRLVRFVERYSVDVLSWDQWELWDGLFKGAGPWSLFRQQHGPHRQGLGGLVIAATAHLSGWDTRAESYVSVAIVAAATIAALALVRRLRGRWVWSDVAVPALMLTVQHYETLVMSPNVAHGPLPLLLVTSFGLAMLVRRERLRLLLLVVLGAVSTHTGFALFLGLIAPLVILLLTIRAARAPRDRFGLGLHVAGLGVSLAAVALFFRGYVLQSAGCTPFPDPEPARYAVFLGDAFVRMFELHGPGIWLLGMGPVVACVALVGWSGWRTVRTLGSEPLPAVTFVFTSFSTLFMLSSAAGRACLPDAGNAARYVPYAMPFVLSVYLLLSCGPRAGVARTAILAGLVGVLLYRELILTKTLSEIYVRTNATRKLMWRDCYLQLSNRPWCDSLFGGVHPDPAATRMDEKLAFLRERRLSFFRSDVDRSPDALARALRRLESD